MKYKYILFDLDGTLIDTNSLIIDSFKHTYKTHLGRDFSDSEILKHFGEPLIITLRRYTDTDEKAQEMFDTYISYNEQKHDDIVTPCRGVQDCLKQLKDMGHTLAIVTSKRKRIAVRGLELFNLVQYFDVIVTLEDTKAHKPDPDPINKALALLNAKPEEALMIGDSIFDILCARNAGVKSALVQWSAAHGHQEEEIPSDYTVHDLCELLDIVR